MSALLGYHSCADLQMSAVELCGSDQSDSLQATGGYLVVPQGQRGGGGGRFRSDVKRQGLRLHPAQWKMRWEDELWTCWHSFIESTNNNTGCGVLFLVSYSDADNLSCQTFLGFYSWCLDRDGSAALFCPLLGICMYWVVISVLWKHTVVTGMWMSECCCWVCLFLDWLQN